MSLSELLLHWTPPFQVNKTWVSIFPVYIGIEGCSGNRLPGDLFFADLIQCFAVYA